MGKIKKLKDVELVGGTEQSDVYPITSTKAIYDENNKRLDSILSELQKSADSSLETENKTIVGSINELKRLLDEGYLFKDVATTKTNPGTPDAKVFYIANGKGTYTNFGSIEVTEDEVVVLYWDTAWHKVSTGIASNEKLTELESNVGESLNGLSEIVNGSTFLNITWKELIVSTDGNLIQSASNDFGHSEPIFLRKGLSMVVYSKSYGYAAIALTDKEASFYTPKAFLNLGDASKFYLYNYTADEDCYVSVSGSKDAMVFITKYDPLKYFSADSIVKTIDNIISWNNFQYEPQYFWNNGYVNKDGKMTDSGSYRHTTPIFIKKGQTIEVTSESYLYSAISLTDKNGSYYEPKVCYTVGKVEEIYIYSYTATEDCYVVVSAAFLLSTPKIVIIKESSLDINYLYGNKSNVTDDIKWHVGYVDFSGQIITSGGTYSNYQYSDVVKVKKGQILKLITDSYGFCVVAKVGDDGNLIPLYNATEPVGVNHLYEYRFTEDCFVVISTLKAKFTLGIYYPQIKYEELSGEKQKPYEYYNAFNLFDFRTLVGRTEWLYKDSLMSGVNAANACDIRGDFNVETREYLINWSAKALKFIKQEAGTFPVQFTMTLPSMQEISKTINIEVVETPNEKLKEKQECNVLFIGDSLIFNNQNLIGREWLRILNTEDAEKHIVGSAIQLPTLNKTKGKLRLYGEYGDAENKYTQIEGAVTFYNKRTSTSGATENFQNPFYNPNSQEPDEIGEDGFNKRVDFGWWFDNNIGVGKIPNLIYMALGPNDYANVYNWDVKYLGVLTDRVVAICKKIKKACDDRVGGDSGVVIKIMQHQFYPPKCQSPHNFPIARQRFLWQKTAEAYVNAFKENNINNYAELIPIASRFDYEIGYTFDAEKYNDRFDGINDKSHVVEATHMNTIGAYNYADVLITDFLADHRFD